MSEQVVISWGIDEFRLAAVQVDGSRAKVVKSARHAWEDGLQSYTVAEAATQLRKWLDEAGIGKEPVTIVLPRESVILRKLDLPDAPDDELPDLVRFQAATKSSTSIDELALDYLPLPKDAAVEGRAAIAVTMDRQKLARIDAVLRGAGMTVSRVTLSTIATARFVQWSHLRGTPLPSPSLVLYHRDTRIEMSIFDGETLVFSHGVRLPEGDASRHVQPLKTEINRATVALSQIHHSATIHHCFLVSAGTTDEDVMAFLRERFSGHLTLLSGADVDSSVQGFEPLVGAVVQPSVHLPDVDLLHPRKKLEKPDRRKLYWSVGGGAAALILGVAYLVFRSQVNAYEDNISQLTADQTKLDDALKLGQPRMQYHDAIAAWNSASADLNGVWKQLSQHAPGTETLYFDDLKIEPKAGDTLATVTGTMRARTPEDIQRFLQVLADAGYRPNPALPEKLAKDPDYPYEANLNVGVTRPQTAVVGSVPSRPSS